MQHYCCSVCQPKLPLLKRFVGGLVIFYNSILLDHLQWNPVYYIDGNLTITTSLDRSRHGSNGNEGLIQISQSSKTGASQSHVVQYESQVICWKMGDLHFRRFSIWVFYTIRVIARILVGKKGLTFLLVAIRVFYSLSFTITCSYVW